MKNFEGLNLNNYVEEIDKHILSFVDFYFDCMCREIDLVDKENDKKEIIYLYFKELATKIGNVYFDKSSIFVDNIIKNINNNLDYDLFSLDDDELRYLINSRMGVLLCIRGHTI